MKVLMSTENEKLVHIRNNCFAENRCIEKLYNDGNVYEHGKFFGDNIQNLVLIQSKCKDVKVPKTKNDLHKRY